MTAEILRRVASHYPGEVGRALLDLAAALDAEERREQEIHDGAIESSHESDYMGTS